MLLRTLFAVSLLFHVGPALAAGRVALVIGVDVYSNFHGLRNAVSDADAIGAALRQLGYETEILRNADTATAMAAIDTIGERLRSADEGVFYFAGHGVEAFRENVMLTADADVVDGRFPRDKSLYFKDVYARLATPGKSLVMIVDACRNDPFASEAGGGRSAELLVKRSSVKRIRPKGRNEVEEGIDTSIPRSLVILMSTQGGATARDTLVGEHSPFAMVLLGAINEFETFGAATVESAYRRVVMLTAQDQTPAFAAYGDFFSKK